MSKALNTEDVLCFTLQHPGLSSPPGGIKAKNKNTKIQPQPINERNIEGLKGPEIVILDPLTQTLICLNPSFGEHG